MTDRYATGVVAALTGIALLCIAFLVPVPYVSMSPGPAFDTLGEFADKPMFTIKGAKTYPTKGNLDFTTVSITSPTTKFTIMDALTGVLDEDVAVMPRDFIYPKGQSVEENDAQSAALLAGSKDHARVAALRAAGYRVPEKAIVVDVTKGAPAEGHILKKDRILAVDGEAVSTTEGVGERVQDRKVGATVSLTVLRDGERRTETITTQMGDDGKPRIGIAMQSTFTYPVKITNNVDDTIGGPSAGAMFALAIYDLLTPGSLTGGLKVAGTGEISASGKVGAIGGIAQKIAGAEDADAEIFLVPSDNCAEAKDVDTDMQLVRITTLKDSLAALEALAEDRDARVPSCG